MRVYAPFYKSSHLSFKFNLWDIAVSIILVSVFTFLSKGWHEVLDNFTLIESIHLSLDLSVLPDYALRTSLRMLIAIFFSLLFSLIYGAIAAKTRIGERLFIPILDILQSVPILGFLSFITIFFMNLFPGKLVGMECAAIFAIFTSQAWNMTFSFYQSLKTIPSDLIEVTRNLNLTSWQRFWRLEVPFAIPQLLWNGIMSMSAGWFFVVASEAISVGNVSVKLPGIGSYLALAIEQQNISAIIGAVVSMSVIIVVYDQLLLRPLTCWATKFKMDQVSDLQIPKSWFLEMIRSARLIQIAFSPVERFFKFVASSPFEFSSKDNPIISALKIRGLVKCLGWGGLGLFMAYGGFEFLQYAFYEFSLSEILHVFFLTFVTLIRVVIILVISSLIWVPIGVWIGLRSSLIRISETIIQFLAAFPSNILFPFLVIPIVYFDLNPTIWLSVLMMIGSQWYILINVISGASAIPSDLHEMARSFHIQGWLKWRTLLLPKILPYYITGVITASGAAWNASIIAEAASWGDTHLTAVGIGSYITKVTIKGDYPHIILSISIMSFVVVMINRFFWHPISNRIMQRFGLN